jgi:hypothetical protein
MLAACGKPIGPRPNCVAPEVTWICTLRFWSYLKSQNDACDAEVSQYFCGKTELTARRKALLAGEVVTTTPGTSHYNNPLYANTFDYNCVKDTSTANAINPKGTYSEQDVPYLTDNGWFATYQACPQPAEGTIKLVDASGAMGDLCSAAVTSLAATVNDPIAVDDCAKCFVNSCCSAFTLNDPATPEGQQSLEELGCYSEQGAACSDQTILPGDAPFVGCMASNCSGVCAADAANP